VTRLKQLDPLFSPSMSKPFDRLDTSRQWIKEEW